MADTPNVNEALSHCLLRFKTLRQKISGLLNPGVLVIHIRLAVNLFDHAFNYKRSGGGMCIVPW